MPPKEKHLETSLRRTGKDYSELHVWIDDPKMKYERHDFTRIGDLRAEVEARHGEEGVWEYIEHLREDMEMTLRHSRHEDAAFEEALGYFGISRG